MEINKISHREDIILYNVLNQEVVFEEYFCNLLQFKDFRDLFLKFISKQNSILEKYNINYNNFDTEMPLITKEQKNYGRADLYLKINNDEFIFEIKNKKWTDLTDNQPLGYLEYLEKKNEHLFFLIPKTYSHTKDIIKLWEFDNVEKQIFYWEDFVIEMTNSEIYDEQIEINLFYEFCLYWFDMRIIKFTEDEKRLLNDKEYTMNDFTNNTIPTILEKLDKIIDNIGLNSDMKIDNETIGYNYSKIINDYILYFGIDYENWKFKQEPLTILIQNHKNNYNDFKLNLNNIELEKIYYNETQDSPKQVGYRVKLNEIVGNDSFQEKTKNLLNLLIKELNSK